MYLPRRHRQYSFARPLAWAVASIALLGAGLPAQAETQYYDYSGSVGTYPFDFFPIDPFTSFYDFSGDTLFVGSSAPGSFSVFAGAWMKIDGLSLGDGGIGNGTANVSGGRIDLGGDTNRLQVGNWGTGSMTVSAGGLVDATVNAGACVLHCYNFVGNGAGTTGTLTVTGSGSEVRTLRSFTVAQAAVFPGFGTLGGTTNGFVNVLDGGTLRTEGAWISTGPQGPNALGTERTFATIVIDGPGSQWIVTRDSIDNTTANINVSTHANAQASINITGGGKLIVDGAGSVGPFDGISLASNGGHADLTVSGVGSAVNVIGANPYINVGNSGATGQGSFSVLDGATTSAMFLNVGRNSAQGALSIDGAGSLMTLSGVGTPGVAGTAGASVGRDGGNGNVTVSNGGRLFITDGGADSRPNVSSPALFIGRGVGSTGALTIDGPGSTVEIVSTSLGLGPGVPDNYNPFVAIGSDNPGTTSGEMTVSNGGKLLLTGNAVSTVADSRTTSLNIGGRSGTPGRGVATVTGAGSEIVLSGYDTLINVGREVGSSGTLNVLDHGRVASTSLAIGASVLGTVIVDNASIALNGYRTDLTPVTGAGTTVGRGVSGHGVLTLTNGARLTIENNTLSGGMSIGGDSYLSGGSGTVTLSGGSSIESFGTVGGSISVGRSGNGELNLDGGSSVSVGTSRSVFVGTQAGAVGTVSVRGSSSLVAGYVGVGSTPGVDTGHGTLIVSSGSSVTATTVEVGVNGLLGGAEGTINGNVIVRGTLSPGESPGRIIINGGIRLDGDGIIMLDVASDGHGGFLTDEVILTPGSSFEFGASSKVVFNFLGDTDPNAFGASGKFGMDTFMRSGDATTDSGLSTVFAPGTDWGSYYTSGQFSAQSNAYDVTNLTFNSDGSFGVVAVPVPEPAEWALMLAGFALLSVLSSACARARRARARSARR